MSDRRADLMVEIEEKIAEYGWHGMSVWPDRKHPDMVPFEYTIGLWKTFHHPELVIVGSIPPESTHGIIHNIVNRYIREGEELGTGRGYGGIIVGYDVHFRQVTEEKIKEHCCWADAYHDREPFPVLQAIFPDATGRFPWDEGYEMSSQELWTTPTNEEG